MKRIIRESFRVLCFAGIALVLMSENRCREDYEFGTQASTATPTETATPDDDDDSTVAVPTTTATATTTPTITGTETPTPTSTASSLVDPPSIEALNQGSSVGLFREIERIGEQTTARAGLKPSNWLGNSYNGEEDVVGASLDSDGDGYTDRLEDDFGSDPFDFESTPPRPVTTIAARLRGFDDDVDGISNEDEIKLGTNPSFKDSDSDGVSDGAELLSGSDPLNATSKPADSDGDGLSDSYEAVLGTDPRNPDSDIDLVRDDLEVALGIDPLSNDSDYDGILDGKEVELGSDPQTPENSA